MKEKGKKSEVYPFKSLEDIKKMTDYYINNEMWIHHLFFILSINLGRRISDTLSFKWEDFFYAGTGKFRSYIEIKKEQKTGKPARLLINDACKEAINLYVEKTGCNVSAERYTNPVFLQLSGAYKGNILSDSICLKTLKATAAAVGIEYNIGTHSLRKTFGMLTKKLHPCDGYVMPVLQKMFNHSNELITLKYIGIIQETEDRYLNDIGNFTLNYILGDGVYEGKADMPVVSIDINNLKHILKEAYRAGRDNAGNTDEMVHVDAISEILSMVDVFQK